EQTEKSKQTIEQFLTYVCHHSASTKLANLAGVGRYKQLISPKLSLRDYDAQVGEALAGVKAMNKVIGLGMPIREVLN
ncbi:MAG: hypothetical protein LPH20_15025, partial [Shewanella sp.]|nr:hypothetical protein [Shewanella sp.]